MTRKFRTLPGREAMRKHGREYTARQRHEVRRAIATFVRCMRLLSRPEWRGDFPAGDPHAR